MKNLLIILCVGLLAASCVSQKKAYRVVAADAVVDASEQEIIRNKYRGLFPEITLPPVQGGTGIDSSLYLAAIENQNILLDQLINAQGFIDSITDKPPCSVSPGDSARLIKNFLRGYRPPPIKIHDTLKVPVVSSDAQATIASQQTRINGLLSESVLLKDDLTKVSQQLKNLRNADGWKYGGGLLLAIIAFVVGLLMRKKSLI